MKSTVGLESDGRVDDLLVEPLPEGDFEMLSEIALECVEYLTDGKGQERHGHGRPILDQPWLTLERQIPGFCASQAAKKIMESPYLDSQREVNELKGAVGYLILKLLQKKRAL